MVHEDLSHAERNLKIQKSIVDLKMEVRIMVRVLVKVMVMMLGRLQVRGV